MTKTIFVLSMTLSLVVLTTTSKLAQADGKNYFYSWPHSHWETLDFKPYVERYEYAHLPMGHGRVMGYDQSVTARDIVAQFRSANLLHKYYIDEETGLSIAEVGPRFYDLSASDKRHMMVTLDRVYNVTASDLNVMFLRDWNTKKDIGQMTQNGLMLF